MLKVLKVIDAKMQSWRLCSSGMYPGLKVDLIFGSIVSAIFIRDNFRYSWTSGISMTQRGNLHGALVLGLNGAEPRVNSIPQWSALLGWTKSMRALRFGLELMTALATGSANGVDLIELGRKDGIKVSES
ncbi:uncharacterized protein PHALS_11745 [Plasmopara halstedii]|uniref:RxLR-like protein n=1 Tax=Plasmopara halstedii TaxID=4781 RepID=A0A0N7L5G3_PLAHL|nr:uncharacterized protein PHALS_11745 [Plasmopara halstedii]CEG41395.1 hypothetical protein PHALS_11745 [Plasmopara halstedii]|eukprot:XP_024577764.1 hypothetical protein PHALS_11745 [Plasmopara halstedii]